MEDFWSRNRHTPGMLQFSSRHVALVRSEFELDIDAAYHSGRKLNLRPGRLIFDRIAVSCTISDIIAL